MSRLKATAVLVGIGIAFLAAQGCGGVSQAKLRNDLKATGLAFHSFHDENKKGPANWDELIAHAKKNNLFPDGIQRVRDAGYTMTWDVNLAKITGGTSNVVLAKPPGAGPKLMMDGSVQ